MLIVLGVRFILLLFWIEKCGNVMQQTLQNTCSIMPSLHFHPLPQPLYYLAAHDEGSAVSKIYSQQHTLLQNQLAYVERYLEQEVTITSRTSCRSLRNVQTGSVTCPIQWVPAFLPRGKLARAWCNHSHPSSAEVKNGWSCTFSSPFMPSWRVQRQLYVVSCLRCGILCTVNTQHTSKQDAAVTIRWYLATCFGRDRPSSGQLWTTIKVQ